MHYASIKHIDWKYLNILLNLWLQCHLPATIFQKIYFSPLSPPEQSLCTKNWGHLSTIIWYIWFSCVALWHCFMKIVSNQIYYLWSWFFELHTWFPHSPEPSWKVSIYQMVSLCMAFNLINKIFLYLLMAFSLSMSWIFGLQTAVAWQKTHECQFFLIRFYFVLINGVDCWSLLYDSWLEELECSVANLSHLWGH